MSLLAGATIELGDCCRAMTVANVQVGGGDVGSFMFGVIAKVQKLALVGAPHSLFAASEYLAQIFGDAYRCTARRVPVIQR